MTSKPVLFLLLHCFFTFSLLCLLQMCLPVVPELFAEKLLQFVHQALHLDRPLRPLHFLPFPCPHKTFIPSLNLSRLLPSSSHALSAHHLNMSPAHRGLRSNGKCRHRLVFTSTSANITPHPPPLSRLLPHFLLPPSQWLKGQRVYQPQHPTPTLQDVARNAQGAKLYMCMTGTVMASKDTDISLCIMHVWWHLMASGNTKSLNNITMRENATQDHTGQKSNREKKCV